MKYIALLVTTVLVLSDASQGREIPDNIQKFYNAVKSGTCPKSNTLQTGFRPGEGGKAYNNYCASDNGDYIWIDGPKGKLTNMDVDCDGDQSIRGDGRCNSSTDTLPELAFTNLIQKFGSISDASSYRVPYVVFGNEKDVDFNPQDHGIKPLSVIAVVCGKKLVYGVWADTNGDSPPVVGETSLSLATACFGNSMNGNNGYDQDSVLYIAFRGDDAVPGNRTDWNARNFTQFENSIAEVGDRLVKRVNSKPYSAAASLLETQHSTRIVCVIILCAHFLFDWWL